MDEEDLMSYTNRLALITGLFFLVLSAPSGADTWYRLESTNFIMYTTASEKAARKLFNELEGFRILVLNFINFEIPADAEKVKIILFKNSGDLRKYTKDNQIAGYAIPTETSAIIVQSADSRVLDSTNVIYHEYVHTLLQHYPGRLPGWYNEGLAELFGATRYIGGKFNVGIAPNDRLEHFSYGGRMASFNDIVSDKYQTHRISFGHDPYVQYWLLAYYFEFGNKERKKDLDFYLLLYNDGMDSLEAFQTAFKQSPQKLWNLELKRYFSRSKIPSLRISIPPERLAASISHGEANMAEVKESLLMLKAMSAARAFSIKEYRKGRKLFQEVIDELDPGNGNHLGIINNYIWVLATTSDDKFRDGKEAVRLGELYIKDKTEKPDYLDTLAAAYAEAGRFEDAIRLQADLVSKLETNDENYAGFVERLERYKSNEPWLEEDDK